MTILYEKHINELYDFIYKLSLYLTNEEKWKELCFNLNVRNETEKGQVLFRLICC